MVGLPLSEGPYLTEGAHTSKGHSCPGDLGLGAKDLSFLISMGRRDLSPRGSGLAWVLILPHLALAQASMKESLGTLPQISPETSFPQPYPVPIPSLPKTIHPFPPLTPRVTIPTVEQPDSSPCSRSPAPVTPVPSQRKSRDCQADPLTAENGLLSLG